MYHHNHQHLLPCLHCHPHGYIRMVQHLIERCILLHMSRDQCIKALAERARILPLVTLTVWRELQKENKDFFQAYMHSTSFTAFTSMIPFQSSLLLTMNSNLNYNLRTKVDICTGHQGWQEGNHGSS